MDCSTAQVQRQAQMPPGKCSSEVESSSDHAAEVCVAHMVSGMFARVVATDQGKSPPHISNSQ